MSATILEFIPRPKPEPTPAKPEITDAECHLLDRVKVVTDRALDVINSGKTVVRGFLQGKQTIATTFTHNGREYRANVFLEEVNDGPRIA
ncbi:MULTISPECIES: hypothetical protein [unclassified Ensifer]|uniref:hypothetical protein n=1 Tax=unclassified Ensifer TaxID=2633371 RepID=UPI000812D62F|nr:MULTISPECIES: hypothetical protein [unclassified Ensifer]OCP21992.1 hypothetical protein BC361_25840 [Ensifer sp. LC54]OCP23228.1 hypothetical protein BC363_24925 [Ensifer sp. LC384]